jgi:hypothetical protein
MKKTEITIYQFFAKATQYCSFCATSNFTCFFNDANIPMFIVLIFRISCYKFDIYIYFFASIFNYSFNFTKFSTPQISLRQFQVFSFKNDTISNSTDANISLLFPLLSIFMQKSTFVSPDSILN